MAPWFSGTHVHFFLFFTYIWWGTSSGSFHTIVVRACVSESPSSALFPEWGSGHHLVLFFPTSSRSLGPSWDVFLDEMKQKISSGIQNRTPLGAVFIPCLACTLGLFTLKFMLFSTGHFSWFIILSSSHVLSCSLRNSLGTSQLLL